MANWFTENAGKLKVYGLTILGSSNAAAGLANPNTAADAIFFGNTDKIETTISVTDNDPAKVMLGFLSRVRDMDLNQFDQAFAQFAQENPKEATALERAARSGGDNRPLYSVLYSAADINNRDAVVQSAVSLMQAKAPTQTAAAGQGNVAQEPVGLGPKEAMATFLTNLADPSMDEGEALLGLQIDNPILFDSLHAAAQASLGAKTSLALKAAKQKNPDYLIDYTKKTFSDEAKETEWKNRAAAMQADADNKSINAQRADFQIQQVDAFQTLSAIYYRQELLRDLQKKATRRDVGAEIRGVALDLGKKVIIDGTAAGEAKFLGWLSVKAGKYGGDLLKQVGWNAVNGADRYAQDMLRTGAQAEYIIIMGKIQEGQFDARSIADEIARTGAEANELIQSRRLSAEVIGDAQIVGKADAEKTIKDLKNPEKAAKKIKEKYGISSVEQRRQYDGPDAAMKTEIAGEFKRDLPSEQMDRLVDLKKQSEAAEAAALNGSMEQDIAAEKARDRFNSAMRETHRTQTALSSHLGDIAKTFADVKRDDVPSDTISWQDAITLSKKGPSNGTSIV